MKLKSFSFLLTLFMSIVASVASAHDFEVDGICYMITSTTESPTVTVSYRGDKYDSYSEEYSCSVIIPESVTFEGKTYGVTSIGYHAFSGCVGLSSITIPCSVTKIGEGAFYGCSGLLSVILNSNVIASKSYTASSTFSGIFGSQVMEYVFGDDVQSIGAYACYNCSSLSSVTLGNSVASIGNYAFGGCSDLTSVIINCPIVGTWFSGQKSIKNFSLGNNVNNINENAFKNCSGLTSVNIPKSITSIGSAAFSGCNSLIKADFASIESLCGIQFGDSTANPLFYAHNLYVGDQKVTDLTIPDGISSVGCYAFYGCKNLSSVTVPESVTSIDTSAFAGCSGLTKAEFVSMEKLCKIGFGNIDSNPLQYAHHLYIGGQEVTEVIVPDDINSLIYTFAGGTYIKDVTIPQSVNEIGKGAFYECSSLSSIIIPNSVTSIGARAFCGCTSLSSIAIPSSVNSMNISSFRDCSGLMSVTIPSRYASYSSYSTSLSLATIFGTQVKEYIIDNDAQSIGAYAFYGCTGLTSVTIGNEVTSIGQSSFAGCTALKNIDVPDATTFIGAYAFQDCASMEIVKMGSGITSIPIYLFSGCSSLTDVQIGQNVQNLGAYAFNGCKSLSSIAIPKAVALIEDYTFQGCTALKFVILEDRQTDVITETKTKSYESWNVNNPSPYVHTSHNWNISVDAGTTLSFYYTVECSFWDRLRIELDGAEIVDVRGDKLNGQSVSYKQTFTKAGNIKLHSDYVKERNTTGLHAASVYNVKTQWKETNTIGILTLGSNGENPLFADCPLESIYIGRDISYPTSSDKGYSPFYRNTSLQSVRFGDAETEITPAEFYGCTNLKDVKIGDGVTTIGDRAFSGCGGLDYFAFGSSVNNIGKEAFSGCTAMTSLISLSTTPPTCGSQALSSINKWECTLFVPQNYIAAYQQADQWEEFFFIKEGTGEDGIKDIEDSPLHIDYSVYDLCGHKLAAPQKGINIIRYFDGTSRRVLVK